MASAVGQLRIELRAVTTKLAQDLSQANASIKSAARGMAASFASLKPGEVVDKFVFEFQKLPKTLKKVERDLDKSFKQLNKIALPIAAIGGLAVKSAIDFETAFLGVRKEVDATNANMAALKKGILDMSREIPSSATEIAKIVEEASKLGVESDSVLQFARVMADMGTVSDMSAETATVAFAKLAKAAKMPQDQFDELASTTVALAGQLSISESKIVNMANKLASAGTQVGLTEHQILSISAALSSMGVKAEGGGQAFAQVLRDLAIAVANGGEKLQALNNIAGVDFRQAFQENAANAVVLFLQRLEAFKKQGGEVSEALDKVGFSNDKVVQSLANTGEASQRLKDALIAGATEWSNNNELTRQAEMHYGTTASQLKILKNNLVAVGIVFGDLLLPGLIKISKGLVDLTSSFYDSSIGTKKLIITLAEIPIIAAGVFGALKLLAGGLAFLTGPIGWVSIAVAAGVVAWIDYRNQIKIVINEIIVYVAEKLNALRNMLSSFENSITGVARSLGRILPPLATVIGNIFNRWRSGGESWQDTADAAKKSIAELKGEIEKETKAQEKQQQLQQQLADKQKKALAELEASLKDLGTTGNATFGGLVDKQDEAAQSLEQLNKEWQDLNRSITDNDLRKALEAAAGSGNVAQFDGLRYKLAQAIADGAIEGLTEAQKSPAVIAAARRNANLKAEIEGQAILEEGLKVQAQIADELLQKQKEAHKESADFWRNTMENAITGTTFDFADSLKQVAIGFAAEMASALTGGFGAGLGSLKELGALMANALSQSISGMIGSGGASIGESITGSISSALGLQAAGSMMGASAGAQFGAGSGAIGAGLGAATGGATAGATAGTVAMPVIGTIIGAIIGASLPKVIDEVGSWFEESKGDVNARARKSIEGWLEDRLAEATSQGTNVSGISNVVFGRRGRFADEAWGEQFQNIAGENVGLFTAMGEAFRALAGVVEEVGPQIGFILAENVNGNINEARLLVQSLGLSVEDLEAALIKAGNKGEQSWHQVEVGLQQLSALHGQGLIEVGNLRGAYEQLIESGGRGAMALVAVRNIAIEAMEAGAQTLAELEVKLKATGQFTESEIRALMDALRQRGIESMSQLSDASDRTLGGIVADLESAGTQWATQAEEIEQVSERVADLDERMERLDGRTARVRVLLDYERVGDVPPGGENVTPFARGGVVSRPTLFAANGHLGLMGEAGPEAILPLKRINGKLGVSADLSRSQDAAPVINIDARGAAPGVENDIRNALLIMKDQAVNEAVYKIREMQRRY